MKTSRLQGELNLTDCREVTLGLAFRRTEHQAITTLFQAVPVESVCSVSYLKEEIYEHHRTFRGQIIEQA
jgi:hypothetical protein